jgi:hypothetical protein
MLRKRTDWQGRGQKLWLARTGIVPRKNDMKILDPSLST